MVAFSCLRGSVFIALTFLLCGCVSIEPRYSAFEAPVSQRPVARALNMATPASFMPTGQQVMPPMGYIAFCLTAQNDCAGGTDTPLPMPLTPAREAELESVNASVNKLPEKSDMARFGRDEVWAYVDKDGGDCEDFTLEKRRRLIVLGWPIDTLLIATARDEDGDGHAVLIVTTSAGDLVLDNRVADVRLWLATPYHWTARQSRERPFVWVSADATRFAATPVPHYPPLGEPAPFLAQRALSHIKPVALASLAF